MAHMVFCVRNKKEMEGLDEPPFDSEFGQKIYKNVSKAAWAEWGDRQYAGLRGQREIHLAEDLEELGAADRFRAQGGGDRARRW